MSALVSVIRYRYWLPRTLSGARKTEAQAVNQQ